MEGLRGLEERWLGRCWMICSVGLMGTLWKREKPVRWMVVSGVRVLERRGSGGWGAGGAVSSGIVPMAWVGSGRGESGERAIGGKGGKGWQGLTGRRRGGGRVTYKFRCGVAACRRQ